MKLISKQECLYYLFQFCCCSASCSRITWHSSICINEPLLLGFPCLGIVFPIVGKSVGDILRKGLLKCLWLPFLQGYHFIKRHNGCKIFLSKVSYAFLISEHFDLTRSWQSEWVKSNPDTQNLVINPTTRLPRFYLPKRIWVTLHQSGQNITETGNGYTWRLSTSTVASPFRNWTILSKNAHLEDSQELVAN